MRTVKWNPFLSGVSAVLGGVLVWAGVASAGISTTNPAAIVVYPKIKVLGAPGAAPTTDTVIQLTNTSSDPVNVRCYYVNANGHCSNNPLTPCDPFEPGTASTCGSALAQCTEGWVETDFAFRLSPKQPIVWKVSQGLSSLPLANIPGPGGHFNTGAVPPSPEVPLYLGELKCIEVGDDEQPVDKNDLKGEATITANLGGTWDSRSYNAVGIPAVEGVNNGDNLLFLGSEYSACPAVLILDHFYDDATDPVTNNDTVRTELTIAPCSEDFLYQNVNPVVVQYLTFNEFEQRFSTSRSIKCLNERVLSDIDTRTGPDDDAKSIFNVAVQGTLTGQTVFRGVNNPNTFQGEGILAVAEEFHRLAATPPASGAVRSTNAFAVDHRGLRPPETPDLISMPAANPVIPE